MYRLFKIVAYFSIRWHIHRPSRSKIDSVLTVERSWVRNNNHDSYHWPKKKAWHAVHHACSPFPALPCDVAFAPSTWLSNRDTAEMSIRPVVILDGTGYRKYSWSKTKLSLVDPVTYKCSFKQINRAFSKDLGLTLGSLRRVWQK